MQRQNVPAHLDLLPVHWLASVRRFSGGYARPKAYRYATDRRPFVGDLFRVNFASHDQAFAALRMRR